MTDHLNHSDPTPKAAEARTPLQNDQFIGLVVDQSRVKRCLNGAVTVGTVAPNGVVGPGGLPGPSALPVPAELRHLVAQARDASLPRVIAELEALLDMLRDGDAARTALAAMSPSDLVTVLAGSHPGPASTPGADRPVNPTMHPAVHAATDTGARSVAHRGPDQGRAAS